MATHNILNDGTKGLDFDSTTSKLSTKLTELETDMQASLETLDPSNMADLLAFQQKTSKLTMLYGVESGVIKAIKDTSQGMIQKMN